MATERLPTPTEPVQLDTDHPWPGLLAYEEDSRAFFHGRKAESADLLQRIQQAPLAVLYGKSGLGKTSLLQAGLFPLLRDNHYLPVYCRLDFSAQAADRPLDQVARRLHEEIDRAAAEYPPRDDGEGLWEYLHRSGAEIWSSDNFPLIPVLVLDQFEELFSPTTGERRRIAQVFDDLADLIENRIPAALASDGAAARLARLDLSAQRYRLVLSFREDFLPDIKAWEAKVPSLLSNGLRLGPMTRQRAIEAIEQAGAAVLEEGAAPLIADFVGRRDATTAAGDRDDAVIEPTLLSLFCQQLNLRRGDRKIDEALIAASGQDILSHFYREALDADDVKGPPDAAVFIEEYLVQGDRYRGAYPKSEALESRLITAKQLEALTGPRHRLLRVVQYADTARLELIHDCLVPVVCRARDERESREAQAELERKAKEANARAREKERINRRLVAQRRALVVALGTVLIAASWAAWKGHVAKQAERTAMAYLAVGGSYAAGRERDPEVSALLALQGLSLALGVGEEEAASRAESQLRRTLNSRLRASLPHDDAVRAIAFSPDSRFLAAASGRRLRIWNADAGGEAPLRTPIEHDAEIRDVVFVDDGLLAAGDAKGQLRLWDARTGDERSPAERMVHEPAIAALATPPGAPNLVATATGAGGSIVLWDVGTGDRIGAPFGQDGRRWYYDLAFTEDGSWLAAADVGSGQTTVWDLSERLAAGPPPALFTLANWRLDLDSTVARNGMLVNTVAFSRDGRLLATGDRYNAGNLWRADTGRHLGALTNHTAPVHRVAFNADGTRLATASEDRTVSVWDPSTTKRLLSLVGHKRDVVDVAFSPDGRRLATASRDGTARIWNAESHSDVVYGAAFSPDNEWLATASGDRTIGIWNVKSQELVARLAGHEDIVRRVAFSPDGRQLASAGHDQTARIWDLRTRMPLPPLKHRDEQRGYDKINDVDYSADGRWLATAGANYNAVVWDAATRQPVFAGRHDDMVWAVAFSPDGTLLASAGEDGMLKMWDVPAGSLVACTEGSRDENSRSGRRRFLDVNFSPDGDSLLMAAGSSSVHVVRGLRRQLAGSASGSGRTVSACEGVVLLEATEHRLDDQGITTARFLPRGGRIATTGSRHQVMIVDADTGDALQDLRVHAIGKGVNEVAFSPNGFWIATASEDGAFHVSPLDRKDLVAESCARLTRRALEDDECEEFLGTRRCPPPACPPNP